MKEIKAKKKAAVTIDLPNDVQAVLIQVGDKWNGLSEWVCVSPECFRDARVITIPDSTSGTMAAVFTELFCRMEEHIIVMASPRIGAAIKEAATASPA